MKTLKNILIGLLLLAPVCAWLYSLDRTPVSQELIVCGWDEVFVLEFRSGQEPKKIWSWRAAESSDLPDEFKSLFRTTDECKPVANGAELLITSSGGGVALIDYREKRVLFYGRAANAHSADALPNGRIAVAASRDPQGRGDRLVIFDRSRSDEPLWTEELPSGHGVVWDDKRQLLWALADADLRIYELRDWQTTEPKLKRVSTVVLPEDGGHDLYPVPGTSLFTVTTANHCWIFDRDARTFVLHPNLGQLKSVKSISIHPETRQLVYVQAEEPNWWAERLHFLNPDKTLHTAGEHFYKARWKIPPQGSREF
ncbi:MAG TPA: DUF6528 family protein [Acidobacteriota bacterium]|nr:DUF6528 family protein [Acidobacteriota bacterium]